MTDPIIERARQFARRAHEGQLRKDGAPYIAHPERVAQLLMRYHYDDEVVAAGWLHDVVEDCGVQLSEIEQLFGKRVASLVDAVTENPALEVRGRKKDRKLRAANGPDGARAIAVADSIDNLTDLVKFHAIAGDAMWASWKGLTPQQKLAHDQENLAIYSKDWDDPIILELKQAIKYEEKLVQAYQG